MGGRALGLGFTAVGCRVGGFNYTCCKIHITLPEMAYGFRVWV